MDGTRFGRQFRALRIRLERRQLDVAGAAGCSRSLIASIDRGQLDGVTVGSLTRAANALGAEIDIRLRWRGEQLDRLVDEAHAALVEALVNRLGRLGWVVEVEVSFSIWGERGSIDILAFHPPSGCLLVVEVKSVVPDSQATLHGLDRKTRLARAIVKDRPWTVRSVSRLVVVGASATSRRRVARLAATWDVALPARGSSVRRWLAAPSGSIDGLLFVAFDSHGSSRRGQPARERVRRRKRAQMAAVPAQDPEAAAPADPPMVTADVAVE